jgi:hypothetical protein
MPEHHIYTNLCNVSPTNTFPAKGRCERSDAVGSRRPSAATQESASEATQVRAQRSRITRVHYNQILSYLRPVKLTSFLFTLYLACLAVYPCSDQHSCADEKKAGITIVDTTDHDHDANESDHCTPFCICSCCSTSMQATALLNIDLQQTTHNTVFIPYRENYIPNTSHSIWQPPKSA